MIAGGHVPSCHVFFTQKFSLEQVIKQSHFIRSKIVNINSSSTIGHYRYVCKYNKILHFKLFVEIIVTKINPINYFNRIPIN
jgi:hypothetical protein